MTIDYKNILERVIEKSKSYAGSFCNMDEYKQNEEDCLYLRHAITSQPSGDVAAALDGMPDTKSLDDLLFRLEYWGNFQYEDGCKFAHEILLDYRNELHGMVERALAQLGGADSDLTFADMRIIVDPSVPEGMVLVADERGKQILGALINAQPKQPDVSELLGALKALLSAVKSSGAMNGMEYDSLGVQVNNAITRAEQKGGV